MGKAFNKIMDGMNDALAFADGDTTRGRTHTVKIEAPDVKTIRRALSMTQAEFADTYRLNADTVRQWEQGRRKPDQPARLLLHLIANNPEQVAAELQDISTH